MTIWEFYVKIIAHNIIGYNIKIGYYYIIFLYFIIQDDIVNPFKIDDILNLEISEKECSFLSQ